MERQPGDPSRQRARPGEAARQGRRGLSAAAWMLAFSRRLRQQGWRTVALAVALWSVALAARAAADPYLPPGFPYVSFFPAVIVAGLLGGLACGVLCAALGGLSAWYFFMPPFWSFEVSGATVVALSFYLFVVAVDLALIQLLYHALDAAARERSQLSRTLAHERTLFAELQHRVANNLAFVSALFGLQKRKLAGNPAALAAFDDARLRLDTIGRLHRRLYDPANADLPFEAVVRELLVDMLGTAGRPDIRVEVECARTPLSISKTMSLSLFVLEAATNSLKHAFRDRTGGLLRVSLRPAGEGRARLVVSDDGPGWPQGGPDGKGGGLGLRILKSFAASAHGALSLENLDGAATCLDFPLTDAADGESADT